MSPSKVRPFRQTMGDEESKRLTHAQVIESTLITVGYNETLDRDLDYAAEVAKRAVEKMRTYEQTVSFNDLSEKEKLKSVLVLNTMYALEKKHKKEMQRQQNSSYQSPGSQSRPPSQPPQY